MIYSNSPCTSGNGVWVNCKHGGDGGDKGVFAFLSLVAILYRRRFYPEKDTPFLDAGIGQGIRFRVTNGHPADTVQFPSYCARG